MKSAQFDRRVEALHERRSLSMERISRTLAAGSALLLLFVAYRSWGTGLVTSGAQNAMREALLAGENLNRSEPAKSTAALRLFVVVWVGAIAVSLWFGSWIGHRHQSKLLGVSFASAPVAIALWNLFVTVEGLLPEGM